MERGAHGEGVGLPFRQQVGRGRGRGGAGLGAPHSTPAAAARARPGPRGECGGSQGGWDAGGRGM